MASLNFSDEEFGQIRCPYFHESVQFDSFGLEHIRRKSWNRGRSRTDQFNPLARHLKESVERMVAEVRLRLRHTASRRGSLALGILIFNMIIFRLVGV